jgi:hypothetical protein
MGGGVSMVQNITGVLRVLSKNGGIKLDANDAWINMAKGLKGFKQADYEKFRNKKVVVTTESGYWILIEEAAPDESHTLISKTELVHSARFGMLFNRTHEEALYEMEHQHSVDKKRFVEIFSKLEELCEACQDVYHDN